MVIQENIKKIHKLVISDRKLKLREIAEAVKISEGSVFTIMHKHLTLRKLFSKWVPRLLTVDQNNNVLMIQSSVWPCLHVINQDETWIHHITPESKRSSSEWTAAREPRPKRPKSQQSAGKIMASVFWDAHGIIFTDYLEKGNSDYYTAFYWIV